MSVKITGMNDFRRNIEKAISLQDRKIRSALSAIGDVAVQETAKRTPFLEGHLTASLAKEVGMNSNREMCVVIKVPSNSPASDYAVAMHEDQYQPGEKSLKKQARSGAEVGRKYMTRGVQAGTDKYKLIIKTRLK